MAPKQKGQAIVYDADAHREFVTGFRKRKQARRAKAAHDREVADKQARRDERKQRREVLRRTADRARGFSALSSDDEEILSNPKGVAGGEGSPSHAEEAKRERMFQGSAESLVVTATVAPMETFASANFQKRLPKRALEVDMKPRASGHDKRGHDAPVDKKSTMPLRKEENAASENVGNEDSSHTTVKTDLQRKLTRARARKMSKMHRHSKIQKERRSRTRLRTTPKARG